MHGDFCLHDLIALGAMVVGPVVACARCLRAYLSGLKGKH